jgi:hypothetical protein
MVPALLGRATVKLIEIKADQVTIGHRIRKTCNTPEGWYYPNFAVDQIVFWPDKIEFWCKKMMVIVCARKDSVYVDSPND